MKIFNTLNKYTICHPPFTLQALRVFAYLLLSAGVQAEQTVQTVQAEQKLWSQKPPIQLDYASQTPPKDSHVLEANQSINTPNKMRNGLIRINRIRLQGDALYPEYGITNAFLHTRINQVYSHMNEQLSISDINKIADALTLAYREKGLTFNQAYVIPQEIVNSTLIIHVLKGTLTDIDIYSNEIYSTEQLTVPFAELMGKVIHEPDIKKVVESINEKPGLKIFSFFSVGSNQGEARLNVRVMDETRHESKLVIDNKGVSQTGINRLMYSHTLNNPLNLSGQLSATVMTTNKPENFFGNLGYSYSVDPTNEIGLSILKSDFAITGQFEDLGLEGYLQSATVSWSNTPEQEQNSTLLHHRHLTLSTKQSTVTSEAFPEFLNEEVDYTMISGTYQLHFLQPWQSNSQHIFTIHPSVSKITNTDNADLPSHFWLVSTAYDFMAPQWIESASFQHPFSVSAKGQYSAKKLPSAEQFTTTGATTNRGFEPGIFSGDSAYSISLEQAVGHPVDVISQRNAISVQPFLFFDYSYGKQNLDEDLSAKFQSAGFGLKVGYKKIAKATVSIGKPLDHRISGQLNIGQNQAVVYAHLSLSF